MQIELFSIWKLAFWGSHIQAGRCHCLAWRTESSDEQSRAVTSRASAEASAQAWVCDSCSLAFLTQPDHCQQNMILFAWTSTFPVFTLLLGVLCVRCSAVSDSLRPYSLEPARILSGHRIFQAGVLEWVAISSSRGSSWPRDRTCVCCLFCIGRQILYCCATWEAHSVIVINVTKANKSNKSNQ